MLKKSVLLFFTVLLIIGCTRDDICPEGSPTTPLLVIKFMDNSSPTEVKAVSNLKIALTSNEEDAIFTPVTDTIYKIPLNPSLPSVQYTLTKSFGAEEENKDNIRFNYNAAEDVYINRACAFKTTYTDLNAIIRNEGAANSNWMLRLEITNDTIENEDITHITVFH